MTYLSEKDSPQIDSLEHQFVQIPAKHIQHIAREEVHRQNSIYLQKTDVLTKTFMKFPVLLSEMGDAMFKLLFAMLFCVFGISFIGEGNLLLGVLCMTGGFSLAAWFILTAAANGLCKPIDVTDKFYQKHYRYRGRFSRVLAISAQAFSFESKARRLHKLAKKNPEKYGNLPFPLSSKEEIYHTHMTSDQSGYFVWIQGWKQRTADKKWLPKEHLMGKHFSKHNLEDAIEYFFYCQMQTNPNYYPKKGDFNLLWETARSIQPTKDTESNFAYKDRQGHLQIQTNQMTQNFYLRCVDYSFNHSSRNNVYESLRRQSESVGTK